MIKFVKLIKDVECFKSEMYKTTETQDLKLKVMHN